MPMERIWVVWLLCAAVVAAELRRTSGCLEKERLGLMELRKSMKPINLTPPPGDCCLWRGVNCSSATGRVQSLRFSSFNDFCVDNGRPNASNFLNISLLLPFEELSELVLGSCVFNDLTNQQDLMKMTRLEMLGLLGTSFSNIVPSLQAFADIPNLKHLKLQQNLMKVDLKGLCQMKNVINLDLSFSAIRGHLPSCIGNLTRLQVLNLEYSELSGNIPSTIANLSHLSSLYLQGNYFSGSFSLHLLANNSKLENLDLSNMYNDFQVETETQSWIPSFQLKYLILYSCNLNKMSNSVIPIFLRHQSQLSIIRLSSNNLQGTFPSWLLQNNSNLVFFCVANNSLTGNLIIPDVIHDLELIHLSSNKIEGKLPDNLGLLLPSLQYLASSKNKFEGNLPSSFGALEHLRVLDLSFNFLNGELPKTLFENKPFLIYSDLSNNLLHGELSLNLTTLPFLSSLYLNNNRFSRIIKELPSQSSSSLQFFDISNNLISAQLSNSIANFSSLQVFIVSNNSLVGGIPDKLCHMRKLVHLDISHNNLFGSISSCLKTLSIKFLYMRNSNLSGAIPDGLSMNASLVDIDLSYNHFSPTVLPRWIYSQHELQILLMSGLQLEGEISTQVCGLENIQIIDLSHNNINGSIPSCIFKMPSWMVESSNDHFVLMSRSLPNTFTIANKSFGIEFTTKGTSISFRGGILNLMNGLDLSSNRLSGQIPPQIGYAEEIHSLNLSNNRLWGSIPSSISKLKQIESLDLSSNNLSGEIPSQIVRLNFLSTFNVSNNNLSGQIPNGGQFSNFDERNYGGNELLCGPQLHRACTTSSSPSTTSHEEEEEEENDDERTFFWLSFIAAYVPAFISVVVIVGMDTRCSRVWLYVVDVVCSKLVGMFAKLKFVLGLN